MSNSQLSTKESELIGEKFKRFTDGDINILFQSLSKLNNPEDEEEIDPCDSAQLLIRNTESFRCLAQLLLSSSSLTKNRLFLFPPLEDPGIGLAFEFEEPVPEMDDIGATKYKKLCEDLEIVPISRIINSLPTDTLDLKYYGLTEKQIRALTDVMKSNSYVKTLILQDNWLTPDMVALVSDMLVENIALQHLSLQECRIGIEGAQILGEILSSLQTLKSLDLKFNSIGDEGLLALRDGFCENTSLKTIDLSHNDLTEVSGETLEKILTENKNIDDIDLSWNEFYTGPGNKKLFGALLNSDHVRRLNLAWNGIGSAAAARPITRYLKQTELLEELDLSNNRLAGSSLRAIRTAIMKNKSLQWVKIGNNIYPPEEAHVLLTALAAKANDPLLGLDMENMYINKESKPVLTKIKQMGKLIKIGGILGDYEIHGPDTRKLLYERCRFILMKPKKPKARKDFGHFILSLPDHPISPDEFQKELKKQKIKKLDKDLVKSIMDLYVAKKQTIDCPALVNNYMSYYPDTTLPPPKPKKGKGKKGGKGKNKGQEDEEVEVEIQTHDLEAAPPEQGDETLAATPSQQQMKPMKSVTIMPTATASVVAPEGDEAKPPSVSASKRSIKREPSVRFETTS